MLESLKTAAENFCIHQIRSEYVVTEEILKERTFIAYIDIEFKTAQKARVYIAYNDLFIQKVATLFLEEELSDEETLQDMSLESTNLIVGSAKVLSEESDEAFVISTPIFMSRELFTLDFTDAFTIRLEGSAFSVIMKELD